MREFDDEKTHPHDWTLSKDDEIRLDQILRDVFNYFNHFTNPVTGLVADNGKPGSAASIAVVGMAITCHLIAVHRRMISRQESLDYCLRVLNFIDQTSLDGEETASGYKGFYYHFLDLKTGARAMDSEVSTIDSSLFFMGALTAAMFFDREDPQEKRVRDLVDRIYARADWDWATNHGQTLTHGWRPECGFLPNRWEQNYSEAMFMYILALGSPTHALGLEAYLEFTEGFQRRTMYGYETFFAGALFIHQLSHCWIDFRHLDDHLTRQAGWNYFENSRRSTLQHRAYAIDNPNGFKGYGEDLWGISACMGPGPADLEINGQNVHFFEYKARGIANVPDDGTVSPWVAVASLPFAPKEVCELVKARYPGEGSKKLPADCFEPSFNPTFPTEDGSVWQTPYIYGLNEGPMMIMIENFCSGLVWNLTKRCGPIQRGLLKAGFTGGWLSDDNRSHPSRSSAESCSSETV